MFAGHYVIPEVRYCLFLLHAVHNCIFGERLEWGFESVFFPHYSFHSFHSFQVCIFFDANLYRGNRTTKVNAGSFSAFDSPNLPPLANVTVKIEGNLSTYIPVIL